MLAAQCSSSFDSPLMTASQSNPRSHQGFRFPKALAVVGLAAVLVGCGGGSSDSAMNTGPLNGPGPSTAEMQAMAVRSAITASQSAIGLVTTMASSQQVDAADRALAALKTAIDEATELSEEVLDAHMNTYNAQSSLLSIRKVARDEYLEAERKKELARKKKQRDDHAKLWIAAINDYMPLEDVEDFDMALDGIVSDLDIDGNNNIKLDDENGDPISPMNHMAPSRGLTAKRFTKTPEESYGVVISSKRPDITTSTRWSWTEYFYTSHPDITDPKFPSPISGTNPQTDGSLTITGEARFTPSHFGGASAQSLALNPGETKTVRFLNAVGVLECTSTNGCNTINEPNTTTFYFSNNDVTFTPEKVNDRFDDVIITVSEIKKDSDYLAFGYWITDTGRENKPNYNIHTFAEDYGNGFGPVTGAVDSLTGSASYSGGAAGVYVLKEGDLTDTPDLYNGEFVAGIELKAQFGDPDGNNGSIAKKYEWKIMGTIDDFRSSTDTTHNLGGWELTLEADLGTRVGTTVSTPSLSAFSNAVTRGGGATGSWNASFFGAGDADGDADDHPDAIAGQFDGHFVNGHVVGTFGAEED